MDTYLVDSALELFLVKRKIKGPSWLSISKFSSCFSHQRVRFTTSYQCFLLSIVNIVLLLIDAIGQVSWCKFEIIVDSPKDIQVSTSSKNTVEIPPVIVTSINLKTIINEKQNINEIVSASIISCSKVKVSLNLFLRVNMLIISIFSFLETHIVNST